MMRAVTLSAILHLLFISVLSCNFFVNQPKFVGNTAIMHAYIYSRPFLINDKIVLSTNTVVRRNVKSFKKQQLKFSRGAIIVKQNEQKNLPTYKQVLASRPLHGAYNELSIILHNLIQQQIVDFDDFSTFAHNRVVTVAFDLFPDGRLNNIVVQRSSKVILIDKLAAHAVQNIQPVIIASKYLSQKTHFVVDVEFSG
jgi:TonB family protein